MGFQASTIDEDYDTVLCESKMLQRDLENTVEHVQSLQVGACLSSIFLPPLKPLLFVTQGCRTVEQR